MTKTKTDQDLFHRLDELGLSHRTIEHPAVYTVEESQGLQIKLEGAHIKNLFLKDRKKQLWLCTVLQERRIDLKALRKKVGAQGNFSFGSPELLMEVLGVVPGSVTPFGVINDTEGRVNVILDEGLFKETLVNCHPLRNDRTTSIPGQDLLKFLEAENHIPRVIDFSRPLTEDL